jgi:methionyl-tRNA synthetase
VAAFAFPKLLGDVWAVVNSINRYIVEEQPWVLAKQEEKLQRLHNVLYNTTEGLRIIAALIAPVVPSASDQIWSQIGLERKAVEARVEDLKWGGLKPGTRIRELIPVFPRIEPKGVEPVDEQKKEESQPQPPAAEVERISIDDFLKTGLRVAEVKAAEKVQNSKKLLKITVDLGNETRTVVAGIAEAYSPEDLIGRQVIIVTNLMPAKLMGVESNGMLLAASVDGKPVLAGIIDKVPNGTPVR